MLSNLKCILPSFLIYCFGSNHLYIIINVCAELLPEHHIKQAITWQPLIS